MAPNFETGHAKNESNFEDLISFCTGYGTTYNPVNENITLPALNAKHTAASAAIQAVKTAKTSFDNAANAREIIFAPLRKLSTRIVNALAATTAAEQTVDDAKTANRKIQGKRAHPKLTDAEAGLPDNPEQSTEPADKTISVSQQSFNALIDHFAQLIQTLTAEPLYLPNETDLKVETLNTLLINLKTANTAVIDATTAYSNGRISRDTVLYAPVTGLVDTALEVKTYVKSLFGPTSPQYKQVSGLQFRRYRK